MTAVTYTFSANTKIKSTEVNQNFTDTFPTVQAWTLSGFNSDNATPSTFTYDVDDCFYIVHGKLATFWYLFAWASNPGFNAYLVLPITPKTSGMTAGVSQRLGYGEYFNASPGLGVFSALNLPDGHINMHLSTATQFGTTNVAGFFTVALA